MDRFGSPQIQTVAASVVMLGKEGSACQYDKPSDEERNTLATSSRASQNRKENGDLPVGYFIIQETINSH
jgi:hypothetical protein